MQRKKKYKTDVKNIKHDNEKNCSNIKKTFKDIESNICHL